MKAVKVMTPDAHEETLKIVKKIDSWMIRLSVFQSVSVFRDLLTTLSEVKHHVLNLAEESSNQQGEIDHLKKQLAELEAKAQKALDEKKGKA